MARLASSEAIDQAIRSILDDPRFPSGPSLLSNMTAWPTQTAAPPEAEAEAGIPSQEQGTNSTYRLPPELKKHIEDLQARYKVPGLCVGVVRKHEGKWESGVTSLGIRNVAGDPWLPNSKHAIASCSKVFAAASVGILIDRGTLLPDGEKLSWRTKIKTVLPDWRMMDKEVEENADIEDALAMRLGIPGNNAAWGFVDDTPAKITNRMRFYRPATPFRRTAIYSNASFILAGEFIAALAGMPYVDFVKKEIFRPLGMDDTQFDVLGARQSGRRVEGFMHYNQADKRDVGKAGQRNFWDEGDDGMFLAAAGGAWSTGSDILLWLRETLQPRILPLSVLAELNRPRTAWGSQSTAHPSLSQNYYGIGQVTSYYRGHRIVGHGGGLPGHYSLVFRLPDDNIALSVFLNDETFGPAGPGLLDTVYMSVIDELLSIPRSDRVDWEKIYLTPSPTVVDVVKEGPPRAPATESEGSSRSQSHGRRPSPDITGTYTDGAYGNLTVVKIQDHPLGPTMLRLLSVYPGNTIPLIPGAPIYLGDLGHNLRGSLLLSPSDGPVFIRAWIKAVKVKVQQEDGGEIFVADVVKEGGSAGCVVTPQGIGMFEDFWGQGGAVGGMEIKQRVEENVEQEAEVWFRKIT